MLAAGLVIVGASGAGLTVAQCLRQRDYRSPVTLLCAEAHLSADVAVVAIGATPATRWLTDSGSGSPTASSVTPIALLRRVSTPPATSRVSTTGVITTGSGWEAHQRHRASRRGRRQHPGRQPDLHTVAVLLDRSI
jgi:hypothetical protein